MDIETEFGSIFSSINYVVNDFLKVKNVSEETKKEYLNIISEASQFIKSLELKDIHEQLFVISYMIWNGYFSINKNFEFNSYKLIEPDNYYTGMDIVNGYGVCRNIASFYIDIMNNMNCSINEFLVKIKYKTELDFNIEKKIDFETITTCKKNKDIFGYGYHMLSLTQDNKGVFLQDPTNTIEYEVLNKQKLICYNGISKIKPVDENLKKLEFNKKRTLNKQELLQMYKNKQQFILDNVDIFNNFYKNNIDNYQSFTKKLIKTKDEINK